MDSAAFSPPQVALPTRTRRPRTHNCVSHKFAPSTFITHVRTRSATRPAASSSPWYMTGSSQQVSRSLTSDERVLSALANRSIVVTGGTGLIGRALVSRLRAADARVTLLSRNPSRARDVFAPDVPPTALPYDAASDTPLSDRVRDALLSADVVVNLAGEPIESERWTPRRKRQLYDSRVVGTRRLVAALREASTCGKAAPTLVSTSAVGYYGPSQSAVFTEDSAPGTDFLATIASAWEGAALENAGVSRTAVLRLGVVLAADGGALVKMMPAFRAFLGGPPGGGRQWFSWVHIDDVVRVILHACAEDKWTGVYNVTAPQPVQLAEFCAELGRALGRPSWLPVPKQAVMAIMGGEAAQLVLAGQQVLPKRTRAAGFVFQYKDVRSALQQLVRAGGSIGGGR